MRVGLTGGIASGKSTVVEILKELGAKIVDADDVARQVVAPGTEGLEQVVVQFGPQYIKPDGTLDRAKLGQRIFSDETERQRLNGILHPLIRKEMTRQMAVLADGGSHHPIIADVPLLIENQLMSMYDRIVVVHVPEAVQVERLQARDGLTEKEATTRVRTQIPLEEKKQYADYLIDNAGSVKNTKQQVDRLWVSLCQEIGQDAPSSNGRSQT